MKPYFPFVLLLLWGCQAPESPVRSVAAGDVKSVTTTFISHQGDTQQKHDRIVSVAEFYPDGKLNKMTNFLSYPYDYSHPTDEEFWAEPDGDQLMHVMDGLTLDVAEWNILYGNNWPVKYANRLESEGHARYGKGEVFREFTSRVTERNDELPTVIDTDSEFSSDEYVSIFSGFLERFQYEGDKVTRFETETKINYDALPGGRMTTTQAKNQLVAMEYTYEGEQLSSFTQGEEQYKFFYEADRLVRSEFHLRGKMRNHRLYYYNAQGLKEKTEIFNTYGEPEYTIEYHYDFYEES